MRVLLRKKTSSFSHFVIVSQLSAPFDTVHSGAFYQFPFRRIYYYVSNKSTGKDIGKTHLCAVLWLFIAPKNICRRFLVEKNGFLFHANVLPLVQIDQAKKAIMRIWNSLHFQEILSDYSKHSISRQIQFVKTLLIMLFKICYSFGIPSSK